MGFWHVIFGYYGGGEPVTSPNAGWIVRTADRHLPAQSRDRHWIAQTADRLWIAPEKEDET